MIARNLVQLVSARLATSAIAGAILLGGVGCQTVDPTVRLNRATATLEHPTRDARQTTDAYRHYRRAVADILDQSSPAGDHAPTRPDIVVPTEGFQGLWRLVFPPRRIAGLHRAGVGLPVIERIKPGGPNAPLGGYHLPATALARFDSANAKAVRLELLDPRRGSEVDFGKRTLPLAMDLQAPLDVARGLGPRPLDGLFYLLRVNRFSQSRLTFLQPYDPDKIPVVFVHGLVSTPRMWGPVVKALLADETIRQRYQFWFFYYPTGQPIPLSAMQLRETLDEAVRIHRVRQPLILIGHSMGGILARAQITGITPVEADQILPGVATLPAGNRVRQALIFEPRRDVARAVFIATPHRGSHMALNGLAGIGIRLIRFPLWIQNELASVADLPFGNRGRRFPTSICGLSPDSRFLGALDRATTAVPKHSIIANRGQSDLERSSDGVVPYTSAHLPDAVSEVVVPAGHGGFSHPLAIQEIKRILEDYPAPRR
jgi:pimeloyl-ACP methyl ester carboxylesterase